MHLIDGPVLPLSVRFACLARENFVVIWAIGGYKSFYNSLDKFVLGHRPV